MITLFLIIIFAFDVRHGRMHVVDAMFYMHCLNYIE